jgi:hypothetical protein
MRRADQSPGFADGDDSRTRLIAGTVVLFVPFSGIGFLLCLLVGVNGWMQFPIIVGFGLLASLIAVRFGTSFAHLSGRAFARFVAPSGNTTPYEYGFSYQQALAAKGDVAGALASYEAVMRASPGNGEAHIRAAELCATSGDTRRALELFRAARAIAGVTDQRDIYASNRLVDLHLAAGDEGRALVELRRLVERYRGTDTAARAREALGRLKSASSHSERGQARSE